MIRSCILAALFAVGGFGQNVSEQAALPVAKPAIWAAIAKSGRLAAALCEDAKVRIWSLPDQRLASTIDAGDADFSAALLSEDGKLLLIADHIGQVRLWNTSTGATEWQARLWPYVVAGAFSPDGKRVALARANEPVEIFEIPSGRKLYELQKTIGGGSALAFSRDGTHIAAGDADTAVRVYDARNGELLTRNAEFLMEPLAAAFAPDGKQVVAGGGDKVVAFMDATSGTRSRSTDRLADAVAYLEFSPDGAYLAVGLMNSPNMEKSAPLIVFDKSGRKLTEWLPPSLVLGGTWTEDVHLIVATSTAEALHLWRVR